MKIDVDKIKKWTPIAALLLAAAVASATFTIWKTATNLWAAVFSSDSQVYWVENINVNGESNQYFQRFLDEHDGHLVFFDAILNASTAGVLKYEKFKEECTVEVGYDHEMPIDGLASYSSDGNYTPIVSCGESTFILLGNGPPYDLLTAPLGVKLIRIRGMFLVEIYHNGLIPNYILTEKPVSADNLEKLLAKTRELRKIVPDPI